MAYIPMYEEINKRIDNAHRANKMRELMSHIIEAQKIAEALEPSSNRDEFVKKLNDCKFDILFL